MLPMKFSFENAAVRAMKRDGDPWFVLSDVCRVLEIGNPSDAARRLDEDEKGVDNIDTLGGAQEMTVVNESGLYSLILTSRKPAAKRFKKWVTAEVLPAIRRDGQYRATPSDDRITIGKDEYIALLKARITALEGRRRIAFAPDERAEMVRLSAAGMGASDIARLIGRNESSVSTFLRRHRA